MVGILALQLGAVAGVLVTRLWGTLRAPQQGGSGYALRLSPVPSAAVGERSGLPALDLEALSATAAAEQGPRAGSGLAPFHRTRGEVEKSSFRSTVEAVEQGRPVSEECGLWGGTGLLDRLVKSGADVCVGQSRIRVHSTPAKGGDPGKENDWSAFVIDNALVRSQGGQLAVTANCTRSEKYSEVLEATTRENRGNAEVTKMGAIIREMSTAGPDSPNSPKCGPDSFGSSRVLLVLAPENFWNWWFFLADLSSNFAALAALLPGVRPGPIHVALLAKDGLEGTSGRGRVATDPMPLAEAYGYLFSSRGSEITRLYAGEDVSSGCYGSVVMLPRRGAALLRNVRHPRDKCFSPALKAMVLHLRSGARRGVTQAGHTVFRDSGPSRDHAGGQMVQGPCPDQQRGRSRAPGQEGGREQTGVPKARVLGESFVHVRLGATPPGRSVLAGHGTAQGRDARRCRNETPGDASHSQERDSKQKRAQHHGPPGGMLRRVEAPEARRIDEGSPQENRGHLRGPERGVGGGRRGVERLQNLGQRPPH